MTDSNISESLRQRWQKLRLFRFAGSVLVDYRILKNYAKTITGVTV